MASPEPTPYAPDDLTQALPAEVGEYALAVQTASADDPMWQQTVLGFGLDPNEVQGAGGIISFADGAGTIVLYAMRIKGVDATTWAETVASALVEEMATIENPHEDWMATGWRSIDGREVYARTLAPESADLASRLEVEGNLDTGFYIYPAGEVLYVVLVYGPAAGPTISEVFAALPA
jgi:hypothetical protein